MDYTWTVSTPTSSSWWAWLLLDTDFLFLFLLLLLLSLLLLFVVVGVEFIFESRSRKKKMRKKKKKKGSMFSLFLAVFLLFFACRFIFYFFCSWTSKQKDGWMVASSLTLHSGQSYPGTREPPGSRTGTRPGWETEDGTKKINKMLNWAGERQLTQLQCRTKNTSV